VAAFMTPFDERFALWRTIPGELLTGSRTLSTLAVSRKSDRKPTGSGRMHGSSRP